MQIGVRFHDTEKLPFEERVKNIRKQGFSCTHIALSKVEDLPDGTDTLTPGYASYLKKTFAESDVDVAILGCYLNLAHPDPVKLHEIQERYRAHLRFASWMGAAIVGTETGAPNAAYAYDKEACHSEEALETFITNLRPVVADAEKTGVIFAIEPVYKHIVWNPKRARRVLDEIGSPNLQIIFDPVNLLHPDNLDHADEVVEEAMDLLKKDIAILHLKDYVLVPDEKEGVKMDCVACGLGEMKFDKIIRFVTKEKPFIYTTLENTKPDNAVGARQFLQSIEERCKAEQ